jgi:hypothetical protein
MGRDYLLFGNIAGVRYRDIKPVVPLRGFPADAAYEAQKNNHYTIKDNVDEDDENCISLATAQKWEGYGYSGVKIITMENGFRKIQSPDWHSHTWLTTAELEEAIRKTKTHPDFKYDIDEEYYAYLGAMQALEKRGNQVRVVIWFDN